MLLSHFPKLAIYGLFAVALSACTTTKKDKPEVTEKTDDIRTYSQGVQLFRDACLDSLPEFKEAKTLASDYEFGKPLGLGELIILSHPEKKYTLQIELGSTCTVTMAGQEGNAIRKEFQTMLKEVYPTLKTNKFPAILKTNAGAFVIQHDRGGAESFVISKQ